MRGLRDKVMVVAGGGTGAAGPGNGAATAIRLADEGARVVVGDLSPEAAAATVALIAERGGTAAAFGFDIADEGSVQDLVDLTVTTYGGLDGVHASAADMSPATLGRDSESDAVTIPLDVWQRTLDVNLTGFLLVVKAAVPEILARGSGALVNTISDAAFVGEPIRLAYATTKAALTAVTRHVASRWGTEGIRCNSIAPGLIARDAAMEPGLAERFGPMPRSRRFGRPEDIAAAAAFLLSDDGEWVNGQVWSINGGHVLR